MARTLEELAARLAGRALVMVDPNCRPSAIADPTAYRARLRRVLGNADVVKVSEEDLAWLSPGVPRRGRRARPAPARAVRRAAHPRRRRRDSCSPPTATSP